MTETNVYLHIPFCRRRCGYCDFNTYAGFSHAIPAYVKALCSEIEWVASRQKGDKNIQTVFFGGGTPSLLSPEQFAAILDSLRHNFDIAADAELTLEANPGTVSRDSLLALHQIGFNRISFGMQSAHPRDLAILDRQHRFEDVTNAVAWSKAVGFKHINLDLIFAIPGQSLERWQETLRLASGFGVDHISLYALTIEEGTPMALWNQRGLLDAIDEELSARMYQTAGEYLSGVGYRQYEISNFALSHSDGLDARCRHNLNTWRYQPYYGFGAGAHGFMGNTRTANVDPIPLYIQRMSTPQKDWPAAQETEVLSPWDQMQEWMLVGLRLTDEGVSSSEFAQRFGVSLQQAFHAQIDRCLANGLLEQFGPNGDRLRLTPRGRLLGNQVFMEFVANDPPGDLQR